MAIRTFAAPAWSSARPDPLPLSMIRLAISSSGQLMLQPSQVRATCAFSTKEEKKKRACPRKFGAALSVVLPRSSPTVGRYSTSRGIAGRWRSPAAPEQQGEKTPGLLLSTLLSYAPKHLSTLCEKYDLHLYELDDSASESCTSSAHRMHASGGPNSLAQSLALSSERGKPSSRTCFPGCSVRYFSSSACRARREESVGKSGQVAPRTPH